MSKKKNVTNLEEVKKKKRIQEHKSPPPATGDPYVDAINAMHKRLLQCIDIEEKLMIKVQELEVRLDEGKFPAIEQPISGIHWTREGPMDTRAWLNQEAEAKPEMKQGELEEESS